MSSKIKQLEEEIIKHKKLYYAGNPVISDEAYDKLEEDLRELNPESEVLEIVGTSVVNNKIKHAKKMLSLNKTYKSDELLKWKENEDLVCTYKIDGSSCSLIYSQGSFILAKTRGNGEFGENITSKAILIPDIPEKTSKKIAEFEVRGEIFCTEENFIHLCDEMVTRGLEKPTSQRNIVAGLLGRKENIELTKYLSFQAFEVITPNVDDFKSETEKFTFLKENKFEIPLVNLIKNKKDLEQVLADAQDFIENGNYLIDGLVFTFNKTSIHEELGETAHHPRYKMAFKFQGESKVATLTGVTWQVSRNGILTPVAEIEPIELSGATISRVTLHNFGMVREFELKAGDQIEIVRSGEVIPKFLSLVRSSNQNFEVPSNCPSCDSKLVMQDIRLLCPNESCPSKVLEEFTYFISKIGIDDLSRKRIEEMIRKGLLTKVSDLYEITFDQLMTLEKVKEKMANKLINNINSTKEVDLLTFLTALGISGGGRNKCEKIIDQGIDTIAKFKKLSVKKLAEIEGFAEKSSQDFIESFNSKAETIDNLLKYIKISKSEKKQDSKISGMKFCITGTLTRKRSEISNDIKKNSGIVQSGVSSATNYLITNDKESSSSKFKKAKELNIPIITEEELYTLMG